jgi:diguanylate cyclase (GGDEF)-like protein/PAS domain S-box-containing protein
MPPSTDLSHANSSVASLAPLPVLTSDDLALVMRHSIGASLSLVTRDLRFAFVNDGFAEAFEMPASALIGMSIRDAYGDFHFNSFMPYVRKALAGETVSYERLGRLQSSQGVWRTVCLSPWRNRAGEIIGAVGTSMKVHELKVSMEALRVANERLSSHMENSPLSVFELDDQLNIVHCSTRVTSMLGLDPKAVIGLPLLKVLGAGQNLKPLAAALTRLHAGLIGRNRVESTHVLRDGSTVHCEWFNSALTTPDGRVSSIMSLVEDVSSRVRAAEQLRHNSLHDFLTGLPNRAALTESLTTSLSRAARTHAPVALLFIDLDGFKSVNDNFGHAAGDEVLREVAVRLKIAVRETDTVGRLGGDEFVVLLDTEVDESTPKIVCDRIFNVLEPLFKFANGQARIGASIGVALHPPLESQADELLRRADAAMYEAKRAGKGCVRYAHY